jgi:prenyltransferase beta subunit
MLIENLRGCMNFDGGFGSTPGGESHGGQSEFLLLLLLFYMVPSLSSSFSLLLFF